mmetsp:Transcript_13497/g.26023  ORF Transcript_13497/g.26023 Transcript_13497/m.26023 type:complete len:382 (+) Transcript_13497:172-1317(+)
MVWVVAKADDFGSATAGASMEQDDGEESGMMTENVKVEAAELQDVRCFVTSTTLTESPLRKCQHVIWGGKVRANRQGAPLALVVPLPIAFGSAETNVKLYPSNSIASVGLQYHQILEKLKLCFPQVVRESLLVQMLMDEEDDEEDEEENDGNKPVKMDDDSDEDSNSDQDSDEDDSQSKLKSLAGRYIEQKAEEKVNMLQEVSEQVMSLQQIQEQLGQSIAQAVRQNEYLQNETAFLVIQGKTPTTGDIYFATRYSFVTPATEEMLVPLSTRPFSSDLADQPVLEPVTRRMDHCIFSLGADRRAGEVNGAGKTAQETLHDMELRHASGSQTVIVKPKYSAQEALSNLQDDIGSADDDALRLRRIVGPWNTVKDLRLQVESL